MVILFVSIVISLTLYITYNDFLNAYIEILKMENYSYLIAIIPISIAVLYKLLTNEFEIEGINVFRLIGSVSLFLFSILFYLLGDIINEFFLEFKALSIVCLLWSSLALFFRPKNFAIAYLSIAILLTFVPIPRQAIDYLSSILTRVVASVVSTITSTQVVEREGMLMLLVKDATGVNSLFEIAPVCSGVVSILSILTIAPLIAYFAIISSSPKAKKFIYACASLAIAVVIVFIGNLIRLILIIELAKHIGSEVALMFFHYTPSIIYVAIATFLAIYTISKFLSMPKANKQSSSITIKFVKPSLSFYLAIATYAILLITYNSVTPLISAATLTQFSISVASLPQLLEKPATAILNSSNILILHDIPEPRISESLGVPAVRRIILEYNATQFVGYIEVADTPTKFHGWYVCVTAQGYDIERSWVEVGNTTIYHMVISKSRTRLLLSYTIYKLTLPEGVTYVRLSIMTPIIEDNIQEYVEKARSVIGNVKVIDNNLPRGTYVFDALVISTNLFTAISIALLILYAVGKFAEYKGIRL